MKRFCNSLQNLKVKYGYEKNRKNKLDTSIIKFLTSDPVYSRLILLLFFVYLLSENLLEILNLPSSYLSTLVKLFLI